MLLTFAIIFAIDSIIHLYASMIRNRILRNISKIFIIPLLILIYITSVDSIKPLFLIALICSWFGDLFLILKGHLFFAFGGVSFGLAHIFFMITYYPYIHLEGIKTIIVSVAALIYLTVIIIYFKNLKTYIPKYLFPPMVLYLTANASMNCFALALFMSNPTILTSIIYIGGLLFFISDCNLFAVRFKVEDAKQNHFIVMFTYIIAELLIVIGIINI